MRNHGTVKILVADDDDHERYFLNALLTRMGENYQVHAVKNGLEALGVAHEIDIDVLLTDLQMPEVDGLALTRAFKALYPDSSVIWITAHGCRQYEKLQDTWVYACLEKPVTIDEIRSVVMGAVEDDI